jgi:hypothetical protein
VIDKISTLEAACIEVAKATDSRGLMIYLCNPVNPEQVRKRLIELAGWLKPECVQIDANGGETLARNIKLLAACLEQHMIRQRLEKSL